MLNVYPQRATNPNDMHIERDENLVQTNLWHIRDISQRYSNCDVLLAYGNLITKRKYLKICLNEILELLNVEHGRKVKDKNQMIRLNANKKYNNSFTIKIIEKQ